MCKVVVGYSRYIAYINDLLEGKEVCASGMRQEIERCRFALARAAQGLYVALVSSGDPGVYGMAGPALEIAAQEYSGLAIEIIPGITAANAAAARLGAPLMLDYACLSLSDLLAPWALIERRLRSIADAGMVLALFNPKSNQRVSQFHQAVDILLEYRQPATPAAIATAVGSSEECLSVTTLSRLHDAKVCMRSIVIIGNDDTQCLAPWLVTSRGYRL